MKSSILFENADLLILNKPAGLTVHSDGRTKEPTVADWLVENYPEIKDVGEPWKNDAGEIIHRPGIVHRLDRDTSGVLVIAKNQPTFSYLKNLFQTRSVSKIYNAFVYGDMKQEEGIINRPIARSRKDFRQWSAARGARGAAREAVTKFSVLERGVAASYLEVRPETGRTHQVRVHLKAIGHPVVCDHLYAPGRPPILGFKRLALHAKSIEFKASNGEMIKVEAPLPDDFLHAKLTLYGQEGNHPFKS